MKSLSIFLLGAGLFTLALCGCTSQPSQKETGMSDSIVKVQDNPVIETIMARRSCGLLGANMILTAQSMGIGSCCLGGPVRFMKSPAAAGYLKKLDFSDGYELLYAIAFGYPDEAPAAKPRDTSKVKFID